MSLRKQAISGTFWTALASTVLAVIQILRLSILTRFLEKSDFGLVAIVVLVLGFTQIFTDLGISISLFSRHDITKKEYSSLYWVSLLLGGFLYIVVSLSAPLVATFYNQPELALLIPVMGLDLVFSTAGRQFRIFRQKELKFKSLALIDIVTSAISLGIAVWVASEGGGAWSIVYSTLFASFTSSVLLIISGLRSHPLVWYINFSEGKSFYKVGLFQTGSQILDYVSSQLDVIIIGKLMGTAELGVYNLVKQLVMRIYALVNPILTRVFIPLLAKLNEDLPLLKAHYLKMLNIAAFVNFAIYGAIALSARELLTIIYGPTFANSAIILQLLCLWGGVASVMNCASSLIVATGKTELGFRWTIVRVIANPVFIIVGYQYGLIGIAVAQMLYALVFYSFYWALVIRKILEMLSYAEYLKTISYFLLCSASLFVILTYLKTYLVSSQNIWVTLIPFGIMYLLGYAAVNRHLIMSLLGTYLKKA